MTTLLTGASGFLGSWIARLLASESEPLRVLARPSSNLSVLQGLDLDIVHGDLLDPASLRNAMDGVQQVYHAAGWISFKRKDAGRVHQVNLEGTVNVFRAALATDVQKVVYAASIFGLGYAVDPNAPVSEDRSFNATGLLDIPYLRAKRETEVAAERAIDRGLPLVRLYPGLCLGPGDYTHSSSAAIKAWLRGRMPAIITGGGICLTDVRDAAAALVAAMERGLPGRRYLATGHNITPEDLFHRLQAITGRRPPLRVGPALGMPLAGLAERLNILPAIDQAQARLMAYHWWYNSSRGRHELGIGFRPLDETLRATVEWLNG